MQTCLLIFRLRKQSVKTLFSNRGSLFSWDVSTMQSTSVMPTLPHLPGKAEVSSNKGELQFISFAYYHSLSRSLLLPHHFLAFSSPPPPPFSFRSNTTCPFGTGCCCKHKSLAFSKWVRVDMFITVRVPARGQFLKACLTIDYGMTSEFSFPFGKRFFFFINLLDRKSVV